MVWPRGIFYKENLSNFIHPPRPTFSQLIGIIIVFCEILKRLSVRPSSYCAT
jgi:hypothetical protein